MNSNGLNHFFRIVWNATKGAWQAVSEIAKGRGKSKSCKAARPGLTAGSFVLLSAAALFGLGHAHAADVLPTGGSVTAGSATISTSGSAMTIHQTTAKMAADWQSFSIGQGNTVTFNQPSASSVAMNRVLGADVSVIQGALKANGQVFLLNPNGVLFTPTAQVNVGGIVASTLNLKTDDFLAGNYKFEGTSSNAVVNQGNITAVGDGNSGGTIALIAAKITNTGTLTANAGKVLLGAGAKVTLDLGGPVKLIVEQGAIDALIESGGAIRADGGTVLLTAKAAGDLASTVINHTGLIEAHTLATGEHGQIALLGDMEAGRVQVAGLLDASAAVGTGGGIDITARQVWLQDGAQLTADGLEGGGLVHVGGGWQGQDSAIANASEVQVDAGARASVAATGLGDGGTAIFWSDDAMRFAGQVDARGGASGGDGGLVEVSGKERLAFSGDVDTRAELGQNGLLLLDPTNLTILNGSSGTTGSTSLWAGTNTTSYNIAETTLEGLSGTVVLRASGTLTVNALSDGLLNMSNAALSVYAGSMVTSGGLEIRTSGNQVYSAPITLGGNLKVKSATGGIGFLGTINGGHGLNIDISSSGRAVFNQAVGGTTPLASITTSATGQTYINANVTTSGAQTYNNNVLIGTQGVAQFVNGDFSLGSNGWSALNQRIYLGTTAIGGFTSPTDSTKPSSAVIVGSSDPFPGIPSTTFASSYVTLDTGSGSCGTGYCIIRGSAIVSDGTVSLITGDSVSFSWKAEAGGDAYDVFGYLLNTATGQAIEILNTTGTDSSTGTNWATSTKTLTASDPSGDYKFVFVAGSYDLSGGLALGGKLSVDSVATSSTSGSALFSGTNCTTCTVTGTSVTFNGNVSMGADLVINNSGASAIAGTVSGAKALTKSGAGALTLSGNNTYTGGTVLNSGTLALNNSGALGASGTINLNGGVLQHSANNTTDYSARFNNTASRQYRIDTNGQNVTYATALSSSGGVLDKQGSGTLTLTANGTYTGATTISGGTLTLQNNAPSKGSSGFAGPGQLVIQPSSTSFSSTFSTSGWNFLSSLGGLTLGKTGNTAGITVAGATTINGPINLLGGALAIDAALTATAGNTITLRASGNVTDGASGYLIADQLALLGGNVLLDSTSNNVGTLAASGVSGLTYTDADALTIGTVGTTQGISATGVVRVATNAGDLTLAKSVATTNTSATALSLIAGLSATAGTAAGGNLIISGTPLVSVGSGGRAVLYSGSLSDSTGLSGLVGAGLNRFRYNADETTNFATGGWLALGSGLYGVFREQPTATLKVDSKAITYGTDPVLTYTMSGLVNGDTLTPTISVLDGGVAATKSTAGLYGYSATPYILSATNPGSSLGYNMGVVNGTLTVAKRDLTASYVASDRVYNGTTTASVQGSLSAPVVGDLISLTQSATFADKHVGTNKTVTVSSVNLTGDDATNYNLTTTGATASADITAAALELTTLQRTKTYDGTTAGPTGGSISVASGTLFTGDTWSGGTIAYADKNAGTGKTLTVSGVTLNDGNSGNNYVLRYTSITDAVINKAPLTVTAPTVTKTYDRTTNASGTATYAGFVGDDTVQVAPTLAFDTKDVSRDGGGTVLSNKTVNASGLRIADSASANMTGNYTITYVANTASTITPAALTVRANDDAKFVTFDDPTFSVSYSGFVNGESAAVLSTPPTVTRAGAGTDEAARTYASALVASDAVANNYAISYTPGQFTIVPSDQLLVKVENTSATYGTDPTYIIASAKYLLSTEGTGTISTSGTTVTGAGTSFDTSVQADDVIKVGTEYRRVTEVVSATELTLASAFTADLPASTSFAFSREATITDGVGSQTLGILGNEISVADGAGTTASFNLTPTGATTSTAGKTVVGAYQLDASDLVIAPIETPNFNALTVVGALTVNQKLLTPSVSGVSKTYDGSTLITGNPVTLTGVVTNGATSDKVTVSGHGNFANKNADTGKSYSFTGLTLADADAKNYYLGSTSLSATDGVIDKRTLAVTFTGVDKTYDQTNTATVVAADNRVAGDTLSIARTATFADKNVALSAGTVQTKAITLAGLGLSGADATNYTLAATTTGVTARIMPKALSISGITVAEKEYDTSTSATTSLTGVVKTGLLSGDVVNLATTAAFSNKNAGNDKLVLLSIVYTGADADNYSITSQQTTTADITAKAVTVSAGGGVTKTYDGTTAMSNVTLVLTGNLDGSNLQVSGLGAFSDANAGTGKGYTLSGLKLAGSEANNYVLAGGATSVTGSDGIINAKLVTLSLSGLTKVYDGTTVYTASSDDLAALSAQLGVAGDAVSGITAGYNTKNVGTGRSVTTSAATIDDGNNGGNYVISYGTTSNNTITRLASVTWIGGASGNWFDPANWAGGAVPDLSNVANVVISAGTTVTFNDGERSGLAEAGTVNLTSLSGGSLNLAAGALATTAGASLDGLATAAGTTLNVGTTLIVNSLNPVIALGAVSAATASITALNGASYGNVSFGNTANNFGTFSAIGQDVSVTDTDGVDLGASQVAGNLAVTTGAGGISGGLTQSGALNVAGTTTFTADSVAGQDATLNTAGNSFGGLVTFTQSNSGSWRDVTLAAAGNLLVDVTATGDASLQAIGSLDATLAIGGDASLDAGGNTAVNGSTGGSLSIESGGTTTFGTTTVAGNLTLTSNGAVSQSGPLSIVGTTSLFAAGQNVTLDDPANDFGGTVSAVANNLALTDKNGIELGNVTASGTLGVEAVGDITQKTGTTIAATGETTLASTDGSIALDGQNNDFGVVNASGENIALADKNGIELGNVTASGTLSVTAAEDITQKSGTTIAATGETTLASTTGSINLDGANNDFNTVNASGANIALKDKDGIELGNVTASDTLSVTAAEDITQKSGTTIAATGETTLASTTGSINLDGANNDFNTVNASGANITLTDTNGMSVALTASGNSTMKAGGNLVVSGNTQNLTTTTTGTGTTNFGATTVAGNLATTSVGAVTQSGPLSVTGVADFSAAGQNVTLDNAANDFGGAVSAKGNNLSLVDKNDLTLGVVDASADFSANAIGQLVLGTTTVGGDMKVDAGRNITLGTTTVQGKLALQTVGGSILQTGPLEVSGGSDLKAPLGKIDLSNVENKFGGPVSFASPNTVFAGAGAPINDLERSIISSVQVLANPPVVAPVSAFDSVIELQPAAPVSAEQSSPALVTSAETTGTSLTAAAPTFTNQEPVEVGSLSVIEVSTVQLQQLARTQSSQNGQEPQAASDAPSGETSLEVLRQLAQNSNPTALALFVIDGGIRRPLEDLDAVPGRR